MAIKSTDLSLYKVDVKRKKTSKITKFKFMATNEKTANLYIDKYLVPDLKAWKFYSIDPETLKRIKKISLKVTKRKTIKK